MRVTKYYAACILLAIEHLHANNIIFKDLKPENIVIQADGKPKLTDFGISFERTRDKADKIMQEFQNKKSTLCITAPEVLSGKPASEASDWWSYGCLLYEIFTGEQPFNGLSSFQIEQNIISFEP